MMNRSFRSIVPVAVLAGALSLTACNGKKNIPVATPATPAAVAPTATLAAAPGIIEQGQGTTLTWQTSGASDITISGLGTVEASGSRAVTPGSSQTYTLVAKGAGGTAEASARVTVNPTTARNTPTTTTVADNQPWNVKDIFFDFDAASIRASDMPVTQDNARMLSQHPETNVLIEGHCDDRGSEEYNMVLGVNRANAVKTALVKQGVDPARIKTVSMGKEKPFCSQDNEECWQQNRRDHFVVGH